MKKQTDEKKKKKLTRKLKKIRGVVMMMMVCVLLLSAATYAWFSLSNLARVSNLTMMVSEADGLQVALDKGTNASPLAPSEQDWKGSIDLAGDGGVTIKGVLKPATSKTGLTFMIPKYDANGEGKVDSFETTNIIQLNKSNHLTKDGNEDASTDTNDNTEGHFYKYTFWMRSLKDNATVRLVHGTNLDTDSRTGTYVVQLDKNNTNDVTLINAHDRTATNGSSKRVVNAATAMRISIIAGEVTNTTTNYAVYEPMCDKHVADYQSDATKIAKAETTANYDTVKAANAMSSDLLLKQNKDGNFTETGNTNGDSKGFITLKKDTATLVTLYIWIEGTDDDCVNQIELDDLKMQLQFEKVKTN